VAWDSRGSTDSVVGLTARAVDFAGNSSLSTSRLITISNVPPPDTTPPVVALTAPGEGELVRGTVVLQASATDNVAVQHVDFLVDNLLVGTADAAPYQVAWDSTQATDGPIAITARGDTSATALLDAFRLARRYQRRRSRAATVITCDGAPATGLAVVAITLVAEDADSGVARSQSLDGGDPAIVRRSVQCRRVVDAEGVGGRRRQAPSRSSVAMRSTRWHRRSSRACKRACATGTTKPVVAITLTASTTGLAPAIATLDETIDVGLKTGSVASSTATVRYRVTSGTGVASPIA
jgi:hypothetical protein